jgi:two-component system, cell cycle response regulator
MNTQLLERLKNSPQLPSLPAIALQVLDLVRREDASINDIAKLVQNDAALATKILKTVNSSFYGLSKEVSTISRALVILGLQSVKTLALGFSLVSSLKPTKGDNFDYELFWKRSIYSAVACRMLAKKRNVPQMEEAFICGLLADIGTLAMHRVMGAEYDDLVAQSSGDQLELVDLCRKAFDLDHAQAGGMLTEAWGMPRVLVEPIRHHHNVDDGPADLRPLIEVVYCGMLCGQMFAIEQPAESLKLVREELHARFNFSSEEIEALLQEISDNTRVVAKLFELNIGAGRDYQDIVAEATSVLTEMVMQSQHQVQQARQQHDQLQQQATTDSLTGCANRAHFTAVLDARFAEALSQRSSLAIIFIDADKFKSVNDNHGHQAGDEVLQCIGKVLRSCVQGPELAARYGGEEFAIVLPGTTLDVAAAKAEKIRALMQAQHIVFEAKQIPMTLSLGVAATDGTAVFASAAQLVATADRAVYAAKQSGRNCVRIFRPRPAAVAV